jgi:methenyltetrahydrofolate cyclohydrolase
VGDHEAGLASEAITSYLRKLAERTAAPGGGATAALNVAQAAALVAMSARFCNGPRHAQHAATVDATIAEADRLITVGTELMDADGESYGSVMAAYQLPKDTAGQRAARSAAVAAALVTACEPAVAVIATAARLLELAQALQPLMNRSIAPDLAAAAEAIRAAIGTSATNLAANLSGITDPAARVRLTGTLSEATALEARADRLVTAIRPGTPPPG